MQKKSDNSVQSIDSLQGMIHAWHFAEFDDECHFEWWMRGIYVQYLWIGKCTLKGHKISENTPARTISRLKNVSEQLRATQGFQLRQFTGIGLCALAQFSLFFVNIETNCLGCLCDQMFKVHHTLSVWQSRFGVWDQVWGTKSCLRPNLFNTVTCLRRRKLRFGRKMASS